MSFTPNDLLKIYVPFVCRTGAVNLASAERLRSGQPHPLVGKNCSQLPLLTPTRSALDRRLKESLGGS